MVAITKEGAEFKVLSDGIHLAICYGSIHLGHIVDDYHDGTKEKAMLLFEAHDEFADDGKPLVIAKEYNMTFADNSTLTKDLKPWIKDECKLGFDTDELIGRPCNLVVNHKMSVGGKNYAQISSIVALKNPKTAPDMVNPPLAFSLHQFDQETFDRIPKWIQKKIATSSEFSVLVKAGKARPFLVDDGANGYAPQQPRAIHGSAVRGNDLSDEVPF